MRHGAWILCLAAMTTSASAQSTHEQAEALFRQGKELMGRQQFAEACAAFESSQKLEPSISTLLNHANCREKNVQLATAWQLFAEAERQTHGQLDTTSKQLNAVAAARISNLEPRLSKLSINVAPENRLEGLEVLRNASRVDPDMWNLALPIDGGTYNITARAPGYAEWSTTVNVKPEGDVQGIAIPRLEPAPVVVANQAAPAPERAAPRRLVVPIAMGGAALVLGGAALAFSRWGDSIYADARREPDNATQEALWDSANKRRYAAIGFAAGAVGCASAAIYLYVRGGREAAQPVARREVRFEPTASASAGAVGIGLRGSW